MSDYYNAFEISPVPTPGPDAVAPEPFRGIYGMPAFVKIPTGDLAASVDFWTRGLGFIELFTIPGSLVHLRRWAFQDVLLVAAEQIPTKALKTERRFRVRARPDRIGCRVLSGGAAGRGRRSAGYAVEHP